MTRGILIAGALLLVVASAAPGAEDPAPPGKTPAGWHVASDVNLTLTQNAYSENWSGSESGAVSWALSANTLAEGRLSDRILNETRLRLAFGQTHSQDRETKEWASPVKSTDLVDLESVFRFTYGWAVDPYVSGRVESSILDERDPAKTRYLNPTLFTESVGIARDLIREEKRSWTVRLGAALRQHLDRDVLDADSGERASETTTDGGLELVAEFRSPLAEDRITLESILRAYQGVMSSEEDELAGTPDEDNWRALDVSWENSLTASITSHLMVNLYVEALYDKEIDQGVRFKETLSLGLTWRLL